MPDRKLQSLVRDYLINEKANIDSLIVDKFLQSSDFLEFIKQLDADLSKAISKFEKTRNAALPVPAILSTKVAPAKDIFHPLKFQSLEPEQKLKAGTEPTVTSERTLPITKPSLNITATPQKAIPVNRHALDDAANDKAALTVLPNQVGGPSHETKKEVSLAATEPIRQDNLFRLKNAREGESYQCKIEYLPQPAQQIKFLKFVIPEDIGLDSDSSTGEITGIPLISGEHAITVMYCILVEGPAVSRQSTFTLLVNPNPKKMWKNLPSDNTYVYWKEDEECSAVKGSKLQILAASKRGRSHAHKAGFRDDDYRIDYLAEKDWYVAVVSDGAGSATYSRQGSKIICENAANYLKSKLNAGEGEDVCQAAEAFYEARAEGADAQKIKHASNKLKVQLYKVVGYAAHNAVKAIEEEVASRTELKVSVKDFSSTALITICKQFSFGTLCAAYWVGDGAVGIYSKTRGITLLGKVDSGEFSGQTRFLDQHEVTQEALLARIRFELLDDLTALFVMTDGVSDPIFETESKLARDDIWDNLWHELNREVGLKEDAKGKEKKLLDWLDFWSPGNHDDRTIAIIY